MFDAILAALPEYIGWKPPEAGTFTSTK